jgi:lipopolysaccharide export system permease protein
MNELLLNSVDAQKSVLSAAFGPDSREQSLWVGLFQFLERYATRHGPWQANALIIERYLIREIIKPMVVICAILVAIFASYTAARYLADAAYGLLSADTIVSFVLLRVAIALEVLLPTTLYLSVVLAVGRMYADSEITALSASGVGITRILRAIFFLALLVAAVVGSISLYVRPWAYEKFYWLKAQAKADFDITRMEGGNFYEIGEGNRIFFAEQINRQQQYAERVFIHTERGDTLQVIYAKQAYQKTDEASGYKVLVFSSGYLYEFSRGGDGGQIIRFQRSTLSLRPEEITVLEYKIKGAASEQLARSSSSADMAELQWRLSTPITTVLFALLGVPLSRTDPRQGKYAKVVVAVIIYALYYNLSAVAKRWVEQAVVGSIPGIFWVQALLAGLLIALFLLPSRSGRR